MMHAQQRLATATFLMFIADNRYLSIKHHHSISLDPFSYPFYGNNNHNLKICCEAQTRQCLGVRMSL